MRPTRDDTLLGVAELIARRSTCNRLNVGAVIARQGRILVTGYNGPPSGMDHCDHDPADNTPCKPAVHAERNAIDFAARYGMATEAAELFVTHSPCYDCAKDLAQAGIVRVVYAYRFRDMTGLELLFTRGIETRWLPFNE